MRNFLRKSVGLLNDYATNHEISQGFICHYILTFYVLSQGFVMWIYFMLRFIYQTMINISAFLYIWKVFG